MRRALLFICLSATSAAVAAQAPTIPPGTRVRIETRERGTFDGTLMSQTSDSFFVAGPGALRTLVASESVTRLRVSEGRSHARGAVRGMKIGAAVGGGGMALVIGAAFIGSTAKDKYNGESLGMAVGLVASGALVGVMYGAGIGALFAVERWTTVYSNPLRVSFRPAPSGAPGVGVSVRF